MLVGGLKPTSAWLDGLRLDDFGAALRLKPGPHPLLLRYDGVGRGHFLFVWADAAQDVARLPLAMKWFNLPGVLPYDLKPVVEAPVGWYRFTAPPGLRSMRIVARGRVQAWAGGSEMALQAGPLRTDGASECKASVTQTQDRPVVVALRIEQTTGCYAGAALPEPIVLECGAGQTTPGDWSKLGTLETYSGGAWYRKGLVLSPDQAVGRVMLNLGEVAATAEVRVNGELAAIRVAPPWRVESHRS